ncbi:MAG TPA: TIM barrel protein [Phycisphaerae bacterium]|nr:TIM barrel protein [Phycisphaerae bacterium]HRY67584.1 TIM barrel protein [Phycisphaerae bacterium]HSA24971.1 TIM barrel protein [Phycisphaerae bacterium]
MSKTRVSRRSVIGWMATGVAGGVVAAQADAANEPPAAKPKGRIRQSVSRWCYNGKLSYEDLCKHAARIGYQAIDLIGPDEWATAKKFGLTASMVPGAGSIGDALNRRENHPRLEAEFRKNIDLAADAGLPNVITFSGNRKGQADDEGIRNCVEGLKRIISYAEKKKINICMEYLNSKVDHKDYQCDHIAFGTAIARQVGSPRFGILYDIYHAQIMEGDIIRTIRANHEYILHYHTGGNPGRNEIDESQEINYTAVMKAIADTGYKGFVGQEFVPKGDALKALEQAFRICDV